MTLSDWEIPHSTKRRPPGLSASRHFSAMTRVKGKPVGLLRQVPYAVFEIAHGAVERRYVLRRDVGRICKNHVEFAESRVCSPPSRRAKWGRRTRTPNAGRYFPLRLSGPRGKYPRAPLSRRGSSAQTKCRRSRCRSKDSKTREGGFFFGGFQGRIQKRFRIGPRNENPGRRLEGQ